MKKSIPSLILQNRRSKIKAYASEYNLTVPILADFFQVPIRVIESDIKAIKLMNPEFEIHKEGLKIFCIYLKKEEVRREVQKHIEEYGSSSRDWARVGFWMEAKHFGEECKKKFRDISDIHKRSLLQRAYSMLKMGFTLDDVRLICSLKKVDMEILRAEIKDEQFENLFDRWAYWQYKDKEQSNVDDIKAAVGASKTKLLRGDNYYYNKKKRQNDLLPSVYVPEISKTERDRRKEEAYELWKTTKITQEELAAKYKKSRVTIGNWIREMKAKNGELLNENHRRNTSEKGRTKSDSDKAERRNACLKIIKPLISKGASITAMSKTTGRCRKNIKRYMKEEGLWEAYLEIRPEIKKYQQYK